ncbi:hypothetical protein Tco_0734695 [Tanacetum coccineum]
MVDRWSDGGPVTVYEVVSTRNDPEAHVAASHRWIQLAVTSEPVQEEIDIFLVLDDLIPPGVENDDSEDEDNELPNLDHQDNPSSPRPPP